MIARALLSVSEKTGIVDFARFLCAQKVEIISTGGTARLLRGADIPVKDISEITRFPEMLDGRVKTLHPIIHGGILFVRGNDEHEKTVVEHGIGAIDLVVVNLYPFAETVSRGASDEEIIENIDIGGPSMLRSAAKNFASVTVVSDTNDLAWVQKEWSQNGETSLKTRRMLAGKVFARTAEYDAMIAKYFCKNYTALFPKKVSDLRYGENPHQSAAVFVHKSAEISVATATQKNGKQMGYCNILDADAALKIVLDFSEPACAIIKHATPCGVAIAKDLFSAYEKALASDSLSAFGGIVACNRPVDEVLAKKMNAMFFEVIIAPSFSDAALLIFAEKENMRLLEIPEMKSVLRKKREEWRSILGGFLSQESDDKTIGENDLKYIGEAFSKEEKRDALFAWKVCKYVKSNAIVLVKDGATVGIGGGQTSRVDASQHAVDRAGENARGAVAASDAFFPFADSVDVFAAAGVSAIIQPGGSKRDAEVFIASKKAGIKMALTATRAFRH